MTTATLCSWTCLNPLTEVTMGKVGLERDWILERVGWTCEYRRLMGRREETVIVIKVRF